MGQIPFRQQCTSTIYFTGGWAKCVLRQGHNCLHRYETPSMKWWARQI